MTVRFESPHINFIPIKPLSDELFNGLLKIYKNATTHKTSFYVPGFENTVMTWPESDEEHQWIIDNILSYYSIPVDEIASLEYTIDDIDDDTLGRRNDGFHRRDWGFQNVPTRTPNSLNFTTINKTSVITPHNDHEADCKINIPIINMSAANLYFRETDEPFYYNSPVLIHCSSLHEVRNINRMKTFNIPERTFFQIVLKKSFNYYKEILPLPNGY